MRSRASYSQHIRNNEDELKRKFEDFIKHEVREKGLELPSHQDHVHFQIVKDEKTEFPEPVLWLIVLTLGLAIAAIVISLLEMYRHTLLS